MKPTKTYIQQLCSDTDYRLDDLPIEMDNEKELRKPCCWQTLMMMI